MQAVQPWGVDSNTHTNLPGSWVEKDMQRIRAFVDAVRAEHHSVLVLGDVNATC